MRHETVSLARESTPWKIRKGISGRFPSRLRMWNRKNGEAESKTITPRVVLLPRPRFCYIEIPAKDVRVSAAFYENVFGWKYPASREQSSEF